MSRVLVVDDDVGVCEVVRAQLAILGIDAETAENGRVALTRLCESVAESEPFDLIILDLVMPEIDGWKVLKAVKNNPLWEDIKVVVISGHADTPTDLIRIIEFDGVFVEKRAGFVDTVGEIVRRILEE